MVNSASLGNDLLNGVHRSETDEVPSASAREAEQRIAAIMDGMKRPVWNILIANPIPCTTATFSLDVTGPARPGLRRQTEAGIATRSDI